MRSNTVPGYKDLFPNGNKTYKHFVQKVPSDIIIRVFIALNNELNTDEETYRLQKRIYQAWTKRFSSKQLNELNNALTRFSRKTGNRFYGMIFGRRYLLEVILKELNNYRDCPDYQDDPMDEYDHFKAYLIAVDEVNKRDHNLINFGTLKKEDPFWQYRILWPPMLIQWEWNEKNNIIYETFKLLCFFKYANSTYSEYVKEYLHSLNFKSVAQLIGSFQSVNKSTSLDDKEAMLRKLVYIKPEGDVEHLKQQSINQRVGQGAVTVSDIRKYPLYSTRRGYMVIDPCTYIKKNFRGPFFELFHKTSLNQKEKFNTYSTNVSDELERSCLVPVLKLLAGSTVTVIHFDDGSRNVPDGYIRVGNKIFLFEYKAYFFPEKLTNNPDYNEIKKYIDERFIKSDKGKSKGIRQLRTQIEIINRNGFDFDRLNDTNEEIAIYPILVHQDFQFSIPGVNEYLNEVFSQEMPDLKLNFKVKPIVVANLEVILDMAICMKDSLYLGSCIDKYLDFNTQGKIRYKQTAKMDDFLNAHASFDELYLTKMAEKLENPDITETTLRQLLELAEIAIADFGRDI